MGVFRLNMHINAQESVGSVGRFDRSNLIQNIREKIQRKYCN